MTSPEKRGTTATPIESRFVRQVGVVVAALALVAVVAAFLAWGVRPAAGAAIGGALGLANWLGLAYVLRRAQSRPRALYLLVPKGLVMLPLTYVLIVPLRIDAAGLGLGLGALVLGVVLTSLVGAKAITEDESDAEAR